MKAKILGAVAISEGLYPFRYLGVPLKPTKWNKHDCGCLLSKVSSLISCWGMKHLSRAGRIKLVVSVLQGIRAYWTNFFILPSQLNKTIDAMCCRFIWGEDNKFHPINWDRVCHTKRKGGQERNLEKEIDKSSSNGFWKKIKKDI